MGQQTLYALLGLIVATSFGLTVMERQVHLQRQAIVREMEEMAGSVAVEVMEVVRGRTFDRNVAQGLTKGLPSDVDLFDYHNSADHFDKAFKCYDNANERWRINSCDDIDDFDDMVGGPGELPVIAFEMGPDEVVYFQVQVRVEYVDLVMGADGKQVFKRKNGPSFYKRITVKVQDKWGDRVGVYIPKPVELSRVMTYNFFAPPS